MSTPANGYCTVDDLLIRSDLTLPSGIDAQKYVNDAADEIDSRIGLLYRTPVKIATEDLEKYRTTLLMLKSINAQLATGRIIMSISSPSENSELDAYGNYLVREANTRINQIANRNYILEGAAPNENTPEESTVSRTMIYNLDPDSSIESFYDFVNPARTGNPNDRGNFLRPGLGY